MAASFVSNARWRLLAHRGLRCAAPPMTLLDCQLNGQRATRRLNNSAANYQSANVTRAGEYLILEM